MEKEWKMPPELSDEEKQKIKDISASLKCPKIVAELLYRKGLGTTEEIDAFLNPRLDQQYDPFLFPDMEKAVQRIIRAIDKGEKITVYGDYDVDGTTATTLLYLGLNRIGANIDYYIFSIHSEMSR